MRPKKRFELRDSDFFGIVLAAGTAWHLKFRPGAARAQISEKKLRKIGTGLPQSVVVLLRARSLSQRGRLAGETFAIFSPEIWGARSARAKFEVPGGASG